MEAVSLAETKDRLLAAIRKVGPGDSLHADALGCIIELEELLDLARKTNTLWEKTHAETVKRTK